jgi:DNA polymerase-3 subunit epsilon
MTLLRKNRSHSCTPDEVSEQGRPDWPGRFSELAARTRDPRLSSYYRQPVVSMDTPISRVPLLALDLETTGLDDRRDAIISIGFIPFDDHRIRCNGAENWIIQPNPPVAEMAVTIHGITHSDLAAAPPFGDHFEALLQAMAGRVVVAHCHEIERRFLAAATLALTGEPLHFPVIDTMAIEALKHPFRRPNAIQRWFGESDSPSLRMDASRARYGLPAYHPHHALTDALATAELFLAQMQDRYSPETPVSALWL